VAAKLQFGPAQGQWDYTVSAVGWEEEVLRDCIRNQEAEDQRIEQMLIWN
jgi:hypothetical protein